MIYLSFLVGMFSSFLILSFIQLDVGWIMAKEDYGFRILFMVGSLLHGLGVYNFLKSRG